MNAVRSAWLYLIISVILLVVKASAYALTNSKGILSDAVESIINVIAAVVALIVMKAVAEPADHEHPYGHGKLEFFSSAFEGGMITFAAVAIGFDAIRSLLTGVNVHELEYGMLLMGFSASVNWGLGYYLRQTGRKLKSHALMASSSHVLSDVWTTVGVIGGLILVKLTGLTWLDPLAALTVAILLGFSGIKIVRGSAGGLIDEIDPESLQHLAAALNQHREIGLIDIHNTRIIRSGHFHHVDSHLVVPSFWHVSKVHEVSHNFEKKVVDTYPFDGEFAFHVDPCESEYCSQCNLPDCPIRRRPFEALKTMTVQSITDGPRKDEAV